MVVCHKEWDRGSRVKLLGKCCDQENREQKLLWECSLSASTSCWLIQMCVYSRHPEVLSQCTDPWVGPDPTLKPWICESHHHWYPWLSGCVFHLHNPSAVWLSMCHRNYNKTETVFKRKVKNIWNWKQTFWAFLKVWCVNVKLKVLVAQPFPTLCDPMDSSPPGSSIHGILQARILEWGAIPFSRGSSRSGIKPGLLHLRHCRQILSCLSQAAILYKY